MGEFIIKKAEFITSVVSRDNAPEQTCAEIAMVGRSNVGKSSLINCLCNNNKLARISSSPGKTRQINFFKINGSFYLVDLPGYGFAKVSKSEQIKWGELMESYLSSGRLSHIFLLLDIRHAPTAEDIRMFDWMVYYGIPFTIVATKADKVSKSKQRLAANTVAKQVGAPPFAIPFSSETRVGKAELLKRIGDIIADAESSTAEDNTEE